jgi:hypothetical protein
MTLVKVIVELTKPKRRNGAAYKGVALTDEASSRMSQGVTAEGKRCQ